MTPILAFEIEGLPPMMMNSRMHHMVVHRERKVWKGLVAARAIEYCYKNAVRFDEPLRKARIVFTRYSTNEPDYDNLSSSFKWILDGLKEAGVIVDDKKSVIGKPDYNWEKAKRGKGKIRVEVYATTNSEQTSTSYKGGA